LLVAVHPSRQQMAEKDSNPSLVAELAVLPLVVAD
jgi:hypothetical protein